MLLMKAPASRNPPPSPTLPARGLPQFHRCSPHVSYRISQQQLDFLTYGPTLSFSKHSDGLFFGRVPAQAVVKAVPLQGGGDALLYARWLTTSVRISAQTRAVSLRRTALSETSRILVADMLDKHILDPPHRHSRTRQSRRSASVSLAPTADQQGRPVVKFHQASCRTDRSSSASHWVSARAQEKQCHEVKARVYIGKVEKPELASEVQDRVCVDKGAIDYTAGEQEDNPYVRSDADLLPAEADLLSGGYTFETSSDDSDSDLPGATNSTTAQPEWLWLFEIMLVWLNVVHSVSDRTCELLLTFMQAVAYTLAAGSPSSGLHKTRSARMARVRTSLGLDGFGISYALCPNRACWTPHLLKTAIDRQIRTCTRCGIPLFHEPRRSDYTSSQPPLPTIRQVKVRFCYEPITTWIQQLLPRPDILACCTQHRQRQRTPGVYRDLYDGSNWCARDGDDSFDLVLHISLMIDWIQPFYRLGTASYSCCVVSVRVDDLPQQLRNAPSYTHVCCVLPGPQKPTAEGLHATLAIMVAELCRLHEEGLQVTELLHPNTGAPLKVRVRLARLLADTDARTITAGFPSHSSKGQFCPWCTVDHDDWINNLLEGKDVQARNAADHRRHALSALPDALPKLHLNELDSLRRHHGACLSVLYKIPGWSSLENAPVDVMHNLDLGLCKHFWTQTLIDGKLIDPTGLQICKEVLQTTTYPIGVTRINPELGHTSGGTPTAAGWSVLSQYVLPILTASSWSILLLASATKTFHTSKVRMVKKGLSTDASLPSTTHNVVAPDAGTAPQHPSSTMASSASTSAATLRSKRARKGKEKEPEFTKAVSLVSMLEASLALALACRLAHSRVVDEGQLNSLHESLKTFVTINATEIDPMWCPYNFHIALHIAEQVRRHGPAWAFWSYPQERSYGLMKRIKTNRHRGGELEHTMHTRSEDRHRIVSLLEATPITPLSRILKNTIMTEKEKDPLSKRTRQPSRDNEPAQGDHRDIQDDVESDIADSDASGDDTGGEPVTLTNSDLQQICVLANRDRNLGQPLFVPCYNYNSHRTELIFDSAATSISRLTVGEFVLRPRTRQHGPRSDPSACIVATSRGQRVAYFQAVIRLRYNDVRSQERSRQYVIVHLLDPVIWRDGPGLSSATWGRLGYLAARPASLTRAIVDVDNVLGPAIVFPGSRILGVQGSVIATMVQSTSRV
ncbi:hypothetical protein A4X13_0g1146 [Tilletia indica]|uniref:DUF4218 domain-containing protein n=1 Tax=Tilletia indica TaxID=43049 RepID=A0A8T8TF89_9BASI|nr:hypothetical protein A4X13_0g1146 [Tilletia indica]